MGLVNEKQKLTDNKLKNISGGAIYRPKCPNCGAEVPGGASSAGKVIMRDGCSGAFFCKDCSESVTEETFDNDFEFYTWQEGSATFGKWRKK